MKFTKPMLAATLEEDDLKDLGYPQFVSPKLDGIRCLKIDGRVMTRTLKLIPNAFIRSFIAAYCPDNLDGELILPGKSFNEIQSAVMSEQGSPDFRYVIFDLFADMPYYERYRALKALALPNRCEVLEQHKVFNHDELCGFERAMLRDGHEGVMVREIRAPYKCGRSTLRQGYLMKLKRFKDAEAVVIGFEEMLHNDNEATIDARGQTKRATLAENMVPKGTLGALLVRDVERGIEFAIGTGFSDEFRLDIWNNKEQFLGKLVKFKYFEWVEKPRFPVFLGFRDRRDV